MRFPPDPRPRPARCVAARHCTTPAPPSHGSRFIKVGRASCLQAFSASTSSLPSPSIARARCGSAPRRSAAQRGAAPEAPRARLAHLCRRPRSSRRRWRAPTSAISCSWPPPAPRTPPWGSASPAQTGRARCPCQRAPAGDARRVQTRGGAAGSARGTSQFRQQSSRSPAPAVRRRPPPAHALRAQRPVRLPPPLPSPLVLSGHAASLTPY